MALDPAAYRLSEDDHQRIFETRIKPRLFAGVAPSPASVAVIFGGQPGSGKSAALDWAANQLAERGGAVQIIGDDLREYHPANARLMREDDKIAAFYTGPDSGRWVEKAMAYAKEQRFNVIIEGTMRDSNVVAATMNGFREAGYEIDARVLAVSFQLSEQGIYQRYERQKATRGGRMTTPDAHQAAYDGLPVTVGRIEVEKLADRLTVYRRGGRMIYENELRDGAWLRPPQAAAVIEAERARPMTAEEAEAYREGYRALAAMV
ncbi:zeta toxin family protein [Acidisoma sp. 7E03]